MDNLTHSLVGIALSRAGLQRVSKRATLLLLISANIPDIDLLSRTRGALTLIEIHRGYTHSLAALVPLALISVFLTAALTREWIPLLRGTLVALAGLISHLLLDWSTSYGIRALLPFSSRWFYLDLNGFYDGVILTVLFFALIWPWFVNLINKEIGASAKNKGRASAIAALLFLLVWDWGRWTMHQRELAVLNSRLYDDQVPMQVAALPTANNPLQWTDIVELPDSFRLTAGSDFRVFRKPTETMVYSAVMRDEAFRYMAYFSRFPIWTIVPETLDKGMGERWELMDLRFGPPETSFFRASALADSGGRILEMKFIDSSTYRQP